jgi:hypothetical protein
MMNPTIGMKSAFLRLALIVAFCFPLATSTCYAFFPATPTPPCDQDKGNKDCGREPDRVEWGCMCQCGPMTSWACGETPPGSGVGARKGISHTFEFYRGEEQAGIGCPMEECVMHKIIESKLEDADGDPVESSGPFHWCSEKGEVKIKCGPRRTWTIVNCGLEDLGPPSSCSGEDDSYKSIRGDVIALAQFYPHWLLKAALYWPYFQYPLKCTVTSEFDQRILVKVGGV